VYVGPQGVLTGSARQAQEAKELSDSAARLEEFERRRIALARRREAVTAQTAALWRQYEEDAEAVERELSSTSSVIDDTAGQRATQGRLRQADDSDLVGAAAATGPAGFRR
jgi:circadian clock protein KaiC